MAIPPIIMRPLYSTAYSNYIFYDSILLALFYLHARSLRALARTSYYKPHHTSYWTPSGLKFTWFFTSRLRVLKGCLPVLHKAPIYISDCD